MFDDAELSLRDVRQMAVATAEQWRKDSGSDDGEGEGEDSRGEDEKRRRAQARRIRELNLTWQVGSFGYDHGNGKVKVSPALHQFKESWNNFIDSMTREWNTLNIISALLLS